MPSPKHSQELSAALDQTQAKQNLNRSPAWTHDQFTLCSPDIAGCANYREKKHAILRVLTTPESSIFNFPAILPRIRLVGAEPIEVIELDTVKSDCFERIAAQANSRVPDRFELQTFSIFTSDPRLESLTRQFEATLAPVIATGELSRTALPGFVRMSPLLKIVSLTEVLVQLRKMNRFPRDQHDGNHSIPDFQVVVTVDAGTFAQSGTGSRDRLLYSCATGLDASALKVTVEALSRRYAAPKTVAYDGSNAVRNPARFIEVW